MIGRSILGTLTGGKDARTCYVENWLVDPVICRRINLALVFGDNTGATYISAPFTTRPFAIQLPDITKHQREGKCHSHFEVEEKIEDHTVARWIVARDNFNQGSMKSLSDWRASQAAMEIHQPTVDLQRVYVGCSRCGLGKWLSLQNHRHVLAMRNDQFYIMAPWE
jgi:hypothetical protein